jgi:MFS family permease
MIGLGDGTASARRTAVSFVVLLGVVSLLADVTYEGARSITGPYLAVLGASGAVVGTVSGLGELIGYGLRLFSGYLSDRTGRYWTLTIAGYAVNLLAVPLLALAGRWEVAALLIIAERTGKAIRTPARDAMLSHATKAVGRGWGFGLHEALDQVGAMLGPLVVAGVYTVRGDYAAGFAVLLLPALLALSVLVVARRLYPRPRDLEPAGPRLEAASLPAAFWLYLAAASLVAAGYADFPLIAFHFQEKAVIAPTWIPILYAMAMGVDALAALVFGRLYDRRGLRVLTAVALGSAFFAPLVFAGGFAASLAGMALWGIGMGAQESIMRAAVAGMAPAHRRGAAYGLFNTGFGVAWFLGSVLMGFLYDTSLPALIAFSVLIQLAAVPLFILVGRRWDHRPQ